MNDQVEIWLERLMMVCTAFLALTEWNPFLRFGLCCVFAFLLIREIKR